VIFFAVHARTLKPVPGTGIQLRPDQGQFECRSRRSDGFIRLVGVQETGQPSRLVGPGRRVGPVGPRGTQVTASGMFVQSVEETNLSDCNLL
jgi:hypothetical protein